ncbi:MAG: 16S rRNA (cytidine(1402)-2'-O)-methyltransferase [bacterium]|nr:16S rRNA (cytidine(1402)-2'-O)-methyltransferase [bacterium]
MSSGTLYLCGTPIGNLEDITLRALRIFKEVDLIAAEDTRITRKLLTHYQIKTPTTSYHYHNRFKKGNHLIELLQKGKNIALVSDAGMPGVSDPGRDLVCLAIENKIPVVPIPGPTAILTALVISGFPTRHFTFEGFLPSSHKKRVRLLKKLKEEERVMIFFEPPHHILKSLNDILEILGDRQITIVRELTKKFEEVIRGNVSQVIERFNLNPPKGELTIVLMGANKSAEGTNC